jgi:two-component system LytT family response regulator
VNGAGVSSAQITVLVVDDERLARDRLRVLLSGEPDMLLVGECANGLEALAAATKVKPELMFLDVQMPDLDGLGVIAALPVDETPEIIFVTAHNAYMERAFEIHAVDYLRKPYTNERFFSALSQARRRVHARRSEVSGSAENAPGTVSPGSRYSPVLAAFEGIHPDPRLAVQDVKTGTWHIVRKDEIEWIQADGSARVRVQVGSDSYIWKKTLTELEHALDPRTFLRIHRSYIVNAARIRQVKPIQKGEFAVILDAGTVIDTGRTYRQAIERFLSERT